MASVSSTSSSTSSTNSLYSTYGNANAVTGLASGLDTESMIEQAVSGFQTKISSLEQKQTTVQWKQTEIRSMITSLNNLSTSYASYKSKTNLSSAAFFTGAVTNSASGANADKVTAVGGSSSNVTINAVTKLATAGTYRVDASAIFGGSGGTGTAIDWSSLADKFDDAGYKDRHITVTLDGVQKSIRFGDLAASDLKGFKDNLQSALDKAFGTGRVSVGLDGTALKFGATDGSSVKAEADVLELGLGSGVTNYLDTLGTVYDALGEETFRVSTGQDGVVDNGDGTYTYNDAAYVAENGYLKSFTTNDDGEKIVGDYLHEAKTLEVNGTKINVTTTNTIAGLLSDINLAGAGVTASYSQLTNQITFTATETGAGSKIAFGGELKGLFQPDNSPANIPAASIFTNIDWSAADADGYVTLDYMNGTQVPGENTIKLKQSSTLQDVLDQFSDTSNRKMNNGEWSSLLTYDESTGEYSLSSSGAASFYFMQHGKGAATKTTLGELVEAANGLSAYEEGEDAELVVTVNGVEKTLTRSSNTVDLDGMSVTLNGTFNVDEDGNAVSGEGVSFTSKVDTERIISAVKSFVEDYNSIMKTVHDAYTTQPLEKSSSSHEKYKPLTDADKEGMSEKTIADYEEKAKTGLLFGDSDLSGLYSKLRGALMSSKSALAEIGISVEYESQSRTNFLAVDEDKLAAALEGDINKVATVFTGKDGDGGLMGTVQSTVKTYASTSAAGYGILVKKAGADESAISQMNNTYQKEIDSLDDQIDNWKSKLSAKIDYYTRQFSLLEQLMSTYNNQSSMLASMMGGGY